MQLFRKIFFWTWLFLFLLFAFWQWNDPDPWLWMSIYVGAALLSALAARGTFPMPLLLTVVVLCLAGAVYYYPNSVSEWVRQEWQQQDLSMKTQDMEEARESFGLMIVAVITGVAALFGWHEKSSKTVSGKSTQV